LKLFPGDFELVERLQKEDVEAFDILYEKYSGKLYAFSLKYLKSTAEAEEIVQTVFLKIWEDHKNLKKESSFKSYLFTITYNDICKQFRKRNYMLKFISDSVAENPLSSFEIEERIGYQSVLERVRQIINKLPEKQKTIFLKSREEGKTTKEIASELNLSPGTVDNYISDSLKFIRNRMLAENVILFLLISMFLF
jgi:RNA polymerase sigma-70 factor (family 1)